MFYSYVNVYQRVTKPGVGTQKVSPFTEPCGDFTLMDFLGATKNITTAAC